MILLLYQQPRGMFNSKNQTHDTCAKTKNILQHQGYQYQVPGGGGKTRKLKKTNEIYTQGTYLELDLDPLFIHYIYMDSLFMH